MNKNIKFILIIFTKRKPPTIASRQGLRWESDAGVTRHGKTIIYFYSLGISILFYRCSIQNSILDSGVSFKFTLTTIQQINCGFIGQQPSTERGRITLFNRHCSIVCAYVFRVSEATLRYA